VTSSVENTGRIAAVVHPGGLGGWLPGIDPASEAPTRATIHEAALAGAVWTDRLGVIILAGVRYMLGGPHHERPFERYVHKLS
jgi:hypothetical protein